MLVSISGLRAFWARACSAGSARCSSRALTSDMTAIRTSALSVAHLVVGEIQSSWASEACS